ncbi:integral membrane channel protein [Blastomyces dermatitidis ATCC 18188]|uniref:Integral membrane channel protein n=1 Tax=Ajellomyces dermatitidis (strain ATCC 18188 / CBS 674.68) TaxID=653446 RepID=F2T7Y1_AJEDA|nr:integral membrane channel protein [Blastomyces dermatitidis ATCC 18188]
MSFWRYLCSVFVVLFAYLLPDRTPLSGSGPNMISPLSNTPIPIFSSPFNTPLSSSPRPLSPRRLRQHDPEQDLEQLNTFTRNGDDIEEAIEDEAEEAEEDEEEEAEEQGDFAYDNGYDDDEDGPTEASPLLPIFSASILDSLPTYPLTHAIRLLITTRCETTLSWDQLRSPQVSQFLLKPIQLQIRGSHFSRATLYALMANCLQFKKEVDFHPENSGASNTRAMVCELLAIKLLKEYTTRELIDALSYDFYPLQGQPPPLSSSTLRPSSWDTNQRSKLVSPGAVRISCLEIAVRAQAKRFLAHPLVVQQLEAIWAGNIVFHFAADSLHRQPVTTSTESPPQGYGSFSQTNNSYSPGKRSHDVRPNQSVGIGTRRSVTLYNPRDASLFKLSRLRVPRYRQVLSTMSFAILLGLFLAVIQRRSPKITTLELVFWFWSAGFMLDELVGFNEQGFSLYLMSFWNTFDVGILLLLFCYYCLRIYGVVAPDPLRRIIANNAYDILAANAVLLLPRLFSVLDHYRYFSQLLIAFRMMAADLVAVFTLIVIACSGFFVAFTFSFGNGDSPGTVIYALFQMLMGFTPAAWQLWDKYNPIGKAILTLFLFICHFLVVTILITVLTNSFMAIVQNANEEHQFVFAVNTLSMVKSDALFSYVAPANVLAWIIAPLRFTMPFPKFIQLNRTVIKITHMPILFTIYLYEKTILRSSVFELTVPVDNYPARSRKYNNRHSHFDAFTRRGSVRVREPSIATQQKDRALEEVFRRPFNHQNASYRGTPMQNIHHQNQRQQQSSNLVDSWMQNIEPGTGIASPEEQDMSTVERLEKQRLWRHNARRYRDHVHGIVRNLTNTTQSIASDPEDLRNSAVRHRRFPYNISIHPQSRHLPQQTDMEGDDELTSSDNEQGTSDGPGRPSMQNSNGNVQGGNQSSSKSSTWGMVSPRKKSSKPSTAKLLSRRNSPSRRLKTPQRHHFRNASGATILYKPTHPQPDDKQGAEGDSGENGNITANSPTKDPYGRTSAPNIENNQHHRKRSPKTQQPAVPCPIIPPSKTKFMSLPDDTGLGWAASTAARHDTSLLPPQHHDQKPSSTLTMDLGSDLGDNNAVGGGFVGAIPSSFATQMAYATSGLRRPAPPLTSSETQDMLSKLVLARMRTLEEGFREVIWEVKELRRAGEREREREWDRRKTNEGNFLKKGGRRGRSGRRAGQIRRLSPILVMKTAVIVLPGNDETWRRRRRKVVERDYSGAAVVRL